jgi:hypothetical protein
MDPNLRQARRFEDLLALETHDAPYVYAGIFSDAGFQARRLSKKKFKLLRRIDEHIQPMLRDQECVYYVTFGSSQAFWESFFLGWVMYYINRRAIVLTNLRILFLQIDSRGRPRDLRSQLDLRAIETIKRTAFGNTKLILRNGKSTLFTRLPRADRKSLQKIVERVRTDLPESETVTSGTEELCPHCYEVVAGRPTACPHCRKAFKSARRAGLLSLLFPGLGDIYLGHWKFAILEILVAAIIWLGFLIPDPNYPLTPYEMLVGAVLIVVMLHGADAVGTLYIARKGHHPA